MEIDLIEYGEGVDPTNQDDICRAPAGALQISPNELEKVEKGFEEIDKKAEETGETIAAMTKKVELYKSAAVKAGADSPIGKEAIAKAAELQGELDKVNELVNRNNTDFDTFRSVVGISQTAINSYGAFQAVSAIVGVENEKLLETMVKLQSAQQLLNALEGARQSLLQRNSVITKALAGVQKAYGLAVGTSTGALKLFRLALIATGIGALVVLIGTLIANWKEFTGWIQKTIDRFEWLQPVVNFFVKQIELVKEGLRALGILESEQTEQAKALAEARLQAAKDEEKAINDRYDFEIAKAQAAGKETFQLEQEKRKALIERLRSEGKALIELAKLNGEFTEEQKERSKELTEEFKRLSREQALANIAQQKKITDNYKKEVAERVKAGDKAAEEEKKKMDEEISRQDAQYLLLEKLRLSAKDKEIADLVRGYEQKFALAEGNAELEKELMQKQAEEIAEIEQTYADDKLARDGENAKRLRDLRLELKADNGELDEYASPEEAKAFYDARREVESERFENELEDLKMQKEIENMTDEEFNLQKQLIEKNNSKAIMGIKKEEADFEAKMNQFKQDSYISLASSTVGIIGSMSELAGDNATLQKTLAVAQIAIDTGVGLSGAVRQAQVVPFPGNIAAIGTGVSAVLSGMVSAKKALSQAKVPGGGIQLPNIPTAGGGGAGGNVQLPQATRTDGNLTSDLLDDTGGATGTRGGDQRITVLSSDITRTQESNQASVENSEL